MDNQFEKELQEHKEHDELYHYGMPRRSGRYPWGSGKEPFQNNGPDILAKADEIARKNPKWTKSQIAEAVGISATDYNTLYSLRKDIQKAEQRAKAYELRNNKQLSNTKIAEMLGTTEGTIRNIFKEKEDRRLKEINETMDVLRESLKKNEFVDVSKGNEVDLNITYDRLKDSVNRLSALGEASIHNVKLTQAGTGKDTTISVIGPIDATWSDAQKKRFELGYIQGYKEHETGEIKSFEPPVSIDSKRIKIRYSEEGGIDKDGVIELRRGVDDLSLGKAQYAQVRIAVDGTHYLKGMAMYGPASDFPKGTDIIFNTNKKQGTPKLDVLKEMEKDADGKVDAEHPFGATIKSTESLMKAQHYYTDSKGNTKRSAINIVREEGDWDTWSRTLSSQFLSKQPLSLINKQLKYTYNDKEAEFKEIKSLTNPIVKRHLLEKFAESCDSDAVYLKAAALPRQGSHVILPLPKMSPKEVYAPNYKNGEKVVLIRYPHAGTFEIPELRVNNNSKYAKSILKQVPDAVGIHPKIAQKLSGADFDGDTVMVIPVNNRVKIQSSQTLKGLKDFEPKDQYKGYDGMKVMSKQNTQKQMGIISNLITDMTLKGASPSEIERAVKHSMVVIDAHKHKLDYKTSEKQNGIAELRKKYSSKTGGAATVISRAKSPIFINERSEYFKVDPKTGEKIYRPTNRQGSKKLDDGTWVKSGLKQQKITKMAKAADAMELVGDKNNSKELSYARYANQMKALAKQARLEALKVPPQEYSKTAAKAYSREVESLNAKLKEIDRQKPLERKAQGLAGKMIQSAKENNPQLYLDNEAMKKVKYRALSEARAKVGKKTAELEISDSEWAAIQAGAIRRTTAKRILMEADMDKVKKQAMPKQSRGISEAMAMRIKNMMASGTMTQAEVAKQLGVSVSTIKNVINK